MGKIIPGGRCTVLRYTGSNDNLDAAVRYLYSEWLPQSGEELRDFPLYFERVSFFPDVPESEAINDVFLPLFVVESNEYKYPKYLWQHILGFDSQLFVNDSGASL